MKTLTTIRVSRIRSLAECHRGGIAAAQMRWDGPPHVATWIGSSVHARIQGLENDPVPDNLRFDAKTTTIERARDSVEKILSAIGEFERLYKPEYHGREMKVEAAVGEYGTKLTGTIDMIASIGGKRGIIDLKTGAQPHSVWIQTALYGFLLEHTEGWKPDEVASLHVPRVGPRTEQRWSFQARPYADLDGDAQQWAWTLDQLCQAGFEELIASPGLHCGYCPVDDCAIRAMKRKD